MSFLKWVMVPLQYCLCVTDHSRALVRFIQVMKPKPRFSSALYLCSDCCVTPCWLIHVCEQQGVVSGVCDSLLSHKECFQSLPTSTGTKYVLNFHSGISTATPGLHQQKRNSWLLALMQVTCEAKGQSLCVLFQIPGNVLACSLCDQWGES